MKKSTLINLILLIILLAAGYLLHINRTYNHNRSEFKLDTVVEINIMTHSKNADALLDSVFLLIDKYDLQFSSYREGSWLYKLNHSDSKEFNITDELFQILTFSEEVYERSNTLFDVTIGNLAEIWDFDKQLIPTMEEIDWAQKNTGFSKIDFSEGILHKPVSLKLNLGGIAKGFIIDRIVDFLYEREVISGIINIGGDIRLFGQNKPLLIGIQHPRKERNELIGKLEASNKAVVTSGDYERYFIENGIRYHHILDPVTGYPAMENLSVTVIADEAVTADAYSTALFLMNNEKGISLVNETTGMEAIIYFLEAGEVKSVRSSGMDQFIKEEL